MEYKKCKKCNLEQPIDCYSSDKSLKDGLRNDCKICVNKYNKECYLKNLEKNRERSRNYQANVSPARRKENDKRFRTNNPEKYKQYRIKQRSKETFKKWRNKYEKDRRVSDPKIKLRIYISTRIRLTIKRNLSFKDSSCLKHLPYTIEELKGHLEKQFKDGMSWENYGTLWHIDHIIPQKLLPFSSMREENFITCWELKNLRPLEKKENLVKGSKTLEEYNEWKSRK